MFFQNKPIIRYLYWQNRHAAIFLQILQLYQKYLGKSTRFDFTLGNKQLIAFLKQEKKIYCFSQMGNNSSLLFSNGKRNFIVFLKKEKVAHIAFSGQEKPQNLRGRPVHDGGRNKGQCLILRSNLSVRLKYKELLDLTRLIAVHSFV